MANGHGGRREGAGRKPGAATKVTREIADRVASEGITPLELMIRLMRQYYAEGKLGLAMDAATRAAPFTHARLSVLAVTGKDGGPIVQVLRDGTDGPQTALPGLPPARDGA